MNTNGQTQPNPSEMQHGSDGIQSALQPDYHPDDATLMSFSNCSLDRSFSILVSCHLLHCARCRSRLRQAEQLGAELLQRLQPEAVSAQCKQQLLARLDLPDLQPTGSIAATESSNAEPQTSADLIPAPLRNWHAFDFDTLVWKRIAPGIRQHKIAIPGGHLSLLRIAPGTSIPAHGHGGSELTLILRGSYSDEIGRFKPGDVADLDDEVEHQPIADRNQDCICLVATDAPLRFHDWVPRLMQRLVFSLD